MRRVFGRETNIICLFAVIIVLFFSCSTTNRGLFSKKTPREIYESSITEAGLKTTALGTLWFNAAEKALNQPVNIKLPYKETGYFAAEQPTAAGYTFNVRRGSKLNIVLVTNPPAGFMLFADLWDLSANALSQFLKAADTLNHSIIYEADNDGSYLLRIQPELLRSGEYTVTITTEPSLAFPVPAGNKAMISSFWGASRDNGARHHQGIDIFGKFRTPVIAAGDGYITSVREGGLGGKVIFMRPDNKNYTLYYAHLDSQIAKEGQSVRTGDTIGLMGNTGNAKGGPPHLHFGIYTNNGAVDPLPFVDPIRKEPRRVTASLYQLNNYVRVNKATEVLSEPYDHAPTVEKINAGTALYIIAAAANWCKIALPGDRIAFIRSNLTTDANRALRKYIPDSSKVLLTDATDTAEPKKKIEKGMAVNVYGTYKNYYLVNANGIKGWIKK